MPANRGPADGATPGGAGSPPVRIDGPSECDPATDGTVTRYGAHVAGSSPTTTSTPNPGVTARGGGPVRGGRTDTSVMPTSSVTDR